ncbi:macrophage mannose receptor 1-like [Lepeophtheirus salmonis]|uniref:macrophage mannose receptor 1-like n=1 Tax=Lepeophtheirus salmonis TaxID=72036 RepID=UPI003AF3E3FC
MFTILFVTQICILKAWSCDPGWYKNKDGCYSISMERLSWNRAYDECSLKGGTILGASHLKSFESTFPFHNVSRIHFNVEYSNFFGRFYESDKEITHEESITWKPGYPQDLKNKACTSFDEEGFIVNIDCSLDLLTSVCVKQLTLMQDSTGLREQELCPKDFVHHEHNCYFFSEERKTNSDAINSCEPMAPEGATLLIIRNQNQNNFINGYSKGKKIWIGLRHLDGNGTYGWPDGSLLKKEDFINWGEGEPSSPSNDKEACAENLDTQWNDCSCGNTIPFACQAEEYHKPTANCDFEDGLSWVEEKSSGMCYTVISREQSWSNAAASCVKLGDSANLVSIGTPQQDKFIRGKLRAQNRKGTYWIGMKKLEDKIFWSDLSPVSYFNWKTLPENGCSKTSLDDDHWIFDECETAKYPSICQRRGKNYIQKPEPVKNDCPDGWKRFGIHCFYFSKEKKNYKGALDFCKHSVKGGNLAIIRTSRLNDFLYGSIESDSYIGLNDIETEGDFVWEDGSSLHGNAFKFWGIGEPNDNDHKENCIEYRFQHRWNDVDCELKRAFICQVEYSICPASSTVLNQHCLYTDYEPKTCNEAEKICQNTLHHGHLASIHDWGVNDFLKKSIKKYDENFWIGLKKSAGVSDFAHWLDGTSIDFNNYLPGEVIEEVEVCELIAADGLWYPEPSDGKHGFACSHKPKYYMGCRSGWVKSDSSCYLLVLEKLSFQKAEGKCKDRGGNLAIIDDKAELDFIEAMYPYESCGDFNSCNENFWIGLSSRKKRAYFEWIDGSEMRIHNWDGLFISSPIEKAMCVWAHQNRRWETVSCDSAAFYLCESPQMISEVVPPSSSGCKESQMAFMHNCYTLFHRLSKFSEAREFCSTQHSKLLTITTREVQNRMVSYIVGIEGSIHIDLQYYPDEKKWSWGDGTIFEFANWKADEPNINIEDEEGICAVIITEGRHLGEWKAIGCSEKRDFICEEPRKGYTESPPITTTITTLSPEFKCPENFDLISNRCFYSSLQHGAELKDFYEADADCKKYGARLAYFESLEEQNEVIGTFPSRMYIGLRYVPFLDRFLWMEPGITFGAYEDWDPGELDLSYSKYCVYFTYYWTLTKCSNKRNYLCSMKPSKEPFTTKTPPTKIPETPCHPDSKDGWFVIAEHDTSSCYKISQLNSTKTWVEARQACLNEKGDLASLHSYEINDYLWYKMENLKSYAKVWIGLNNLYPDKVHRWSDGSVIDFSNWAEGEPNDYLGMEGCAEMYVEQLGVWNDMHCRNENHYICKKPRYGTYPTQNPTPPSTRSL